MRMKLYLSLTFLILMSDDVRRMHTLETQMKLYRLNAADRQVAEVDVHKMAEPKCYSDGYIAWKEEILLTGSLRFTESSLHIVDVYWQQESGRTNLICRFDVKKERCAGSPCLWWEVTYHQSYNFKITQIATPEINNSMFLMVPMMKNANWQAVSDVVKVHPSPLPVVKMNDKELDPENCFVDAPVGTKAMLEFCVEHLSSPLVSVSVMKNPEVYQQMKCVKQNITLTWEELEVHMTYIGGCKQFGSVTCYFNGLNQTSSEVESYEGNFMTVLGILFLICIGIGLIIYGYTSIAKGLLAGKEKKGKKENKKSKDPVNIGHDIYTDTEVIKSKSKQLEAVKDDEDSSSSSDDEDGGFCGGLKNLFCSLQ